MKIEILDIMKRFCFVVLVVLVATNFTIAQKSKVVSAWNYLKYDEIDKAQEAIDMAIVNDKTKVMAKTWYYRGLVYQNMIDNEQWKKLSDKALEETYRSFTKSLEINATTYKEDIDKRMVVIGLMFYNQGVNECKIKEFDKALVSFDYALKVNPDDMQALYNSAYASYNMKDMTKAKSFYQKLVDKEYDEPRIYHTLADIYKNEGDETKFLEILELGRKRFPGNNVLIIDELNYYLKAGKQEEALTKLNEAVVIEPNNSTLFFALGVANDKLGNAAEAIKAYKKAVELKDDYFDAVYNIGALYFNNAVDMVQKADDIRDPKKFETAKAEYETEFETALPHLERAHELNDKDQNTIVSLKQLYARIGDYEKSKAMKAKLQN
ncbi:tetratricopeptide repeat protein [bacterium AH-315-C07]|nr:tetratricopeptide repeat protein [bacterium AH-315-C07]